MSYENTKFRGADMYRHQERGQHGMPAMPALTGYAADKRDVMEVLDKLETMDNTELLTDLYIKIMKSLNGNRERSSSVGKSWKNPLLYKTSLCDYFLADTECKFGDRCWYAHGEEEQRYMPMLNEFGNRIEDVRKALLQDPNFIKDIPNIRETLMSLCASDRAAAAVAAELMAPQEGRRQFPDISNLYWSNQCIRSAETETAGFSGLEAIQAHLRQEAVVERGYRELNPTMPSNGISDNRSYQISALSSVTTSAEIEQICSPKKRGAPTATIFSRIQKSAQGRVDMYQTSSRPAATSMSTSSHAPLTRSGSDSMTSTSGQSVPKTSWSTRVAEERTRAIFANRGPPAVLRTNNTVLNTSSSETPLNRSGSALKVPPPRAYTPAPARAAPPPGYRSAFTRVNPSANSSFSTTHERMITGNAAPHSGVGGGTSAHGFQQYGRHSFRAPRQHAHPQSAYGYAATRHPVPVQHMTRQPQQQAQQEARAKRNSEQQQQQQQNTTLNVLCTSPTSMSPNTNSTSSVSPDFGVQAAQPSGTGDLAYDWLRLSQAHAAHAGPNIDWLSQSFADQLS